jgi:hypothetical protein
VHVGGDQFARVGTLGVEADLVADPQLQSLVRPVRPVDAAEDEVCMAVHAKGGVVRTDTHVRRCLSEVTRETTNGRAYTGNGCRVIVVT